MDPGSQEVLDETVDLDLPAVLSFHVDSGHVPGIVVAVGTSERTLYLDCRGHAQLTPSLVPMRTPTVFDLASVTKVVATSTLAAQLIDEGRLGIDQPIRDIYPELADDAKGDITIEQLWTHTGGLKAFMPFHKTCQGRDELLAAIYAEPADAPPGAARTYSDLGLILLGHALERVGGAPLDVQAQLRIFGPLGMHETCYCPSPALAARAASTEFRPGAAEPCRGTVHDENAEAMGGVSGHAGLFSTASDLCRFARTMLRGGELEGVRVLSERAMGTLFTRDLSGPAGPNWRGWMGVGPDDWLATVFTESAYGHTGFTGTSLWCDPGQDLFVVCLTNGVHPSRECNGRISAVRMSVYRAARRLSPGCR